jgi:ribosomal protein S18
MKYIYGRKFGPHTVFKRHDRFGRWVKLLLDPEVELEKHPDRQWARFLTRYGAKIVCRHVNGLSSREQRDIARRIKVAREKKVIPYFVNRTVGWYFRMKVRQYRSSLRPHKSVVRFVRQWRSRQYRKLVLARSGKGGYKADVVWRGYREPSGQEVRERRVSGVVSEVYRKPFRSEPMEGRFNKYHPSNLRGIRR